MVDQQFLLQYSNLLIFLTKCPKSIVGIVSKVTGAASVGN